MNIKQLLILSLILSILSVGIVSAAQTPDNLTVEDSIDDQISVDFEEDDVLTEDGVYVHIYNEFETNSWDDEEYLGYVEDENNYLNGSVTLSIDGKQYYNKVFTNNDRKYDVYFNLNTLNLPDSLKTGKHSVILNYLKNGVTSYSKTNTVEFRYEPDINYNDDIATGEPAIIFVDGLSGTSGTATLYHYDRNTDKIGAMISTVTISNGKCQIMTNALPKGDPDFALKMTINGQEFSKYIYLDVKDNTAGYSAKADSTITVGNNAVVTFSGPKTNGWLEIYVDGINVKSIRYYGGSLSETVGGLTVGNHIISVEYSTGGDFYYKTFKVKVLPKKTLPAVKLALKKVNVKKSAKKLPLTATLKINKKAAKGKKITFNFNGKKYSAKTNKKGVAKVTIKSPVLKKLKAGKKITYLVTYGKNTIKKTAKVKK